MKNDRCEKWIAPHLLDSMIYLDNKWGVLLCRKGYQTNATRQNSRSKLLKRLYKVASAIRKRQNLWSARTWPDTKLGTNLFGRRSRKPCDRAQRAQKYRQAKEAAQQSRRGLTCRSATATCGKFLLKKLASLGFERRAAPAQKAQVVQKQSPANKSQ